MSPGDGVKGSFCLAMREALLTENNAAERNCDRQKVYGLLENVTLKVLALMGGLKR